MDYSLAHLNNQREWDRRAMDAQDRYSKVATEAELRHPLPWIDPNNWLDRDASELDVLCLCSGGGRHAIQWAAAGARVTVVDISNKMLELDRRMADRFGFKIQILQASMDRLGKLDDSSFDVVTQPVSLCYTPQIQETYKEVARVLRIGGLYFNQQKQPPALQSEARPSGSASGGYLLNVPYDHQGPLPSVEASVSGHRESGMVEYLHSWTELIGGLCRAGFVIEDFAEPQHADTQSKPGSFGHRAQYLPPFFRVKARRINSSRQGLDVQSSGSNKSSALWVPGR